MRHVTRPAALALAVALASAALAADEAKSIFDGKSPAGWKINTGGDLPAKNVQADGLNPHGSGGYIVMYDKPVADFVLSFDYKLTKGCNSGVFVRVQDPKDPVYTGLEIALDDTKGTGMHDPGAFYDLASPKSNAQKPAGEWNHMTVTAKGPKIAIELNGQQVNAIDLDQFDKPGKRPDGSDHKFTNLAPKTLQKAGYLGFQDHGQDCWFKDVKLTVLD